MVIVTETVPWVRSIAVGFWIGVGSRFEKDSEAGMSHFIEHMLFKGTNSRSAKQIAEVFDNMGAELNAFTTKEFTCLYTRLLDEHLSEGLEVLADMICNSSFQKDQLQYEQQVVLEEIAMYEDTPDEQIHELFARDLWRKHPLGKQILGSQETVAKFNQEMVKEFFARTYQPANITIAATGNLDHDNFVKQIEAMFPKVKSEQFPRQEETYHLEQQVNVYKKKTEQVHLCYGTAALHARHPQRFALWVLENILGGGMSSRLFQKIREEKGLAYSVYSYHSLYQETGSLCIYVGTRPSNVNQVVEIINSQLSDIVKNGVTKDELDRAKEHLKGQLLLSLESTKSRMTRLGKSELVHGEILSVDQLVKRIVQVDSDDIRQLAGEIFQPQRMVLTVIGWVKKADLKKVVLS